MRQIKQQYYGMTVARIVLVVMVFNISTAALAWIVVGYFLGK